MDAGCLTQEIILYCRPNKNDSYLDLIRERIAENVFGKNPLTSEIVNADQNHFRVIHGIANFIVKTLK